MSRYKYAFQNFNKELMARAIGRDMAISTKQAIEICNYLRHRKVAQAKMLLEGVKVKKQAVPFRRFTNGLGHKSGKLAAGRYPVNAATAILKLIESAEANAQTKGLNTGELEIIHICAHKAHCPVHYGRNHGREFKRTHVEIVLQETVAKESKKSAKKVPAAKPAEKPAAKPEAKPANKPAEKPAAKEDKK
ncbi:50S ribosomal protein L22 [Candidatus Woesearchaeota archaeon]|nr:50S ribosomal protein L22 [Candidatus Woesearchaeota archaeon]